MKVSVRWLQMSMLRNMRPWDHVQICAFDMKRSYGEFSPLDLFSLSIRVVKRKTNETRSHSGLLTSDTDSRLHANWLHFECIEYIGLDTGSATFQNAIRNGLKFECYCLHWDLSVARMYCQHAHSALNETRTRIFDSVVGSKVADAGAAAVAKKSVFERINGLALDIQSSTVHNIGTELEKLSQLKCSIPIAYLSRKS